MRILRISVLCAIALAVAAAGATTIVSDYESLAEGVLGNPVAVDGVTYHDLNTVAGVFPDGGTFDPQPDDQFIIEDAGLFYVDFPGYGSPVNAMTFGIAFVPGDNLTIGGLATVAMDLPSACTAAALDIAFYENGVWGGIVWHLDGLLGGTVVASTEFAIAGDSDRDDPTWTTLSIAGASFDQLHLYATYGADYSMPRGMIDNLTLELDTVATVPTSWSSIKALYAR